MTLPSADVDTLCPRCGAVLDGPWVTWCRDGNHYVEDAPRAEPTARGKPAKPTLPPRLEEEIQAGIRAVLELHGFRVWNLSQPRATKQSPGLADLFAAGAGVNLWVEVKRPGGEQSPDQRAFQAHVVGNGGNYVVWSDESEAVEWVKRQRGDAWPPTT